MGNDKNILKCIDRDDFVGDYCDYPNACWSDITETGIYRNKRNCGRFYTCTALGDGSFWQKDYICPFDYQIPDPEMPDVSTQCTAETGRIAYNDPLYPTLEDDFIICQKYGDKLGQLGPFYCPEHTVFKNGQCELN